MRAAVRVALPLMRATSAAGSSPEDAARRACLAAWPEAEAGAHNPACCRFPKSCSIPEDAGERVGLSEEFPDARAALRHIVMRHRKTASGRCRECDLQVPEAGCPTLIAALIGLTNLDNQLAAVEQERDQAQAEFRQWSDIATDEQTWRQEVEQEAAALREQVAALAALGEEWAGHADLFEGERTVIDSARASVRIRDALADPASVLAQRDAEVVNEFVHWVAVARAHNGSEHQHGQSLYNECINAALPEWAREWAGGSR